MAYASTREIVDALRGDDEVERDRLLAQLDGLVDSEGITALDRIRYDWPAWARDEQLAPDAGTEWLFMFLRAGRGGGKTRAGAEMMIEASRDPSTQQMALIAPKHTDIRQTMVEGTSGILVCSPPWWMPVWNPGVGTGMLTWPNGVKALCFSAEKPGGIRGPEFGFAWGDEIAEWGPRGQEVHDLLNPGLRLGKMPRAVYTSTPKPTAFVEWLHSRARKVEDDIASGKRPAHKRTYIERVWSTWNNAANLPALKLEELIERYGGTTQGREQLEGELLLSDPTAMWSHDLIDSGKVTIDEVPELVRVVVSVDNATTESKPGVIDPSTIGGRNKDVGSNDTGIIVVGLGVDGHYYVLDDQTVNASPKAWGERILMSFQDAWQGRRANDVVVEKNAGGDLIKRNLTIVMKDHEIPVDIVPIRYVTAKDGKDARAEPVHALYEQKRVHHVHKPALAPGAVSPLADLEYQMTRFKRGRTGYKKDRVDALVWGITALIEAPKPGGRARAAAERHRRMTQ